MTGGGLPQEGQERAEVTSTEPLRRGRLGLGLYEKQAEEVGAQAGDGSSGQCGGRQAGAGDRPVE